jgi:hypothetical protein
VPKPRGSDPRGLTLLVARPQSSFESADLAAQAAPLEQWLRWEEQANLRGFRVSTSAIEVGLVRVPRDDVVVRIAAPVPPALLRRFVRDDHVLWPQHPLNRDASVAFFDSPAAEFWRARFTSSRTLVIAGAGPLCSLKLPTDHPHPDFVQPEKTRLRQEVSDALRFARRIERIDRHLGRDPGLVLVREVLGAVVPEAESGFLVRDLAPLADGSRWLPGLSLPFCGPALASRMGVAFEELWAVAYAEAVGRAKAKLLARYGLEYDTPNPQNILVQLDAALRPTGTIALRDLGDTDQIVDDGRRFARARLRRELRPETRNSFWAFDEADECGVPTEIIERWCRRHDRAYVDELARTFATPRRFESVEEATQWLRSDAGETALTHRFGPRRDRQVA